MSTVDFTLEELRLVIREEVGREFKDNFDAAFKPAFEGVFEPHALAIQDEFNRIHDKLAEHDERFDHLETDVDALKNDMSEVKADIKGIKRLVGQHSKEIIELRARTA